MMSLEEHESASEEIWEQHDLDQSSGSGFALGDNLYQSEEQGFDSLPQEIAEISEESGRNHAESEFTMYNQLTLLQDTFKTVGGDLEEIKTLMVKLRDVLKSDEEQEHDLNKQRHCCSGESSNDISVIKVDEGISHELEDEKNCPTRESSTESLDDSKYSTLIADIEVLKNKLVSLKRNLGE